MKKNITVLCCLVALLASTTVFGQMRMPAPSPSASVSGTFGVTKVTVDYSAPGVKGRKIWGELLPFDKVWRAGANAATQITFEDDVKIEGKEVKAGSYSLFMTPKEKGNFTIYLDPSGKSVFSYGEEEAKIKEAEGVIMFEGTTAKAPFMGERLAYYLTADAEGLSGIVALHWENKLVSFNVVPATKELAKKSIEGYFGWFTMANTATYYIENDMNVDVAMNLAEASLATTEHFYNTWVLATVHAKKGNKAEALKLAMKAKELGDASKNQNFYNVYKDAIAKGIKDWK